MKKFSKKEAVKFGWQTFKKNWKFFVISLIIFWVASTIVDNIFTSIAGRNEILSFVLNVALQIFQGLLLLGLARITLNLVDKKKISYRMLYESYPQLLQYVIATFLYYLMVIGGLILLVAPGLYLAVKFMYYPYAIVDKKVGALDSFKVSSKITKGNMWNQFLLGLIMMGIFILGFLFLGVGLFIAIPVALLGYAHVYRKLEN